MAGPINAEEAHAPVKAGKGSRKKRKEYTPDMQARLAIQMAAKSGDIAAALAVYDECKREGVRVAADSYSSLLYMCSLGEEWEAAVPRALPSSSAAAAVGPPKASVQDKHPSPLQSTGEGGASPAGDALEAAQPPSAAVQSELGAAEVMARGQQIFQEMQQQGGGKALPEMCYTALARMAAVAGKPSEAFSIVKQMQAEGIPPRLRSFTPALVGFAEQGDFSSASEVDAAIAACSLDLTESEFARLMQAAALSASWEEGRLVLLRMGRELTTLQRRTLDLIAAFFESQQAQQAFAPGERSESQALRWEVGECHVDEHGVVTPACRGRMRPVDLDAQEWVAFREGIASLAETQEKRPNEFRKFLEWLERNGPFGAVVDGANVALFGQNFESGGFTFGQIRAVRDHLREQHPDLKPLVILHNGRTRAPQAQRPEAQQLLQEMKDAGEFFASPTGSNDDWYWIYASVAAGERGLLVSNDEMRDHIFQLLAPKFFMKWKQRHQLKYKFGVGGLQFEYPAPFTTCVQELACGSWVFPAAEGPWLCARRVPPLPVSPPTSPSVAAAEGARHDVGGSEGGAASSPPPLRLASPGTSNPPPSSNSPRGRGSPRSGRPGRGSPPSRQPQGGSRAGSPQL